MYRTLQTPVLSAETGILSEYSRDDPAGVVQCDWQL